MRDDIQRLLVETEARMNEAVKTMEREMSTITIGRLSPAILDSIKVDYHGVMTPISHLATIRTGR